MRVPSSIFPSIYIRLPQVDNHEYLEFTKVSNHCECKIHKIRLISIHQHILARQVFFKVVY